MTLPSPSQLSLQRSRSSDGLIFPLVHNGRFKVMDESYVGRQLQELDYQGGIESPLRFMTFVIRMRASRLQVVCRSMRLESCWVNSDTKTTEIYSHLSVNDLQGTTSNWICQMYGNSTRGKWREDRRLVSLGSDALAIQLQ